MAKRRNEPDSPFEELLEMTFEVLKRSPWWAGPILAAAVYVVAAIVIPGFFGDELVDKEKVTLKIFTMFANVLKMLAPLLAAMVLIVWVVAMIHKRTDQRRLDKQTGIESIRELSWRSFESLLGETYRRQGFRVEDTSRGGGADGGVDLILRKRDQHWLVQAKQWRTRRVGVKVIRELAGVVAAKQSDGGIVVTSGTYTAEAVAFAEEAGIELINGTKLEAMVRDVQKDPDHATAPVGASGPVGAPLPAVSSTPTPRNTAQPPTPVASPSNRSERSTTQPNKPSNPPCPKCGETMVIRTAKRGANKDGQFWGCTRFPQCRGVLALSAVDEN